MIYRRGDCMIIYKIINRVNGKIYIGQTVQKLEERIRKHFSRAKTEIQYKYPLVNAIRKYGENNFDYETIEIVDALEKLNEREVYWIRYYNSISPNGYNATEGGEGTEGYKHKEKDKLKMKKLKINKYNGENNPFYGKRHSQAQIEKWKQERKGRKLTEEWKANISKTRKRKKIINLDTGEVFESIRHVCRHYGKDPNSGTAWAISNVCNKKPKYKTVLGYRFEYYEPLLHDNTVPSLKFLKEGVTTR